MSELRPAALVIAAVGNHHPPDAWGLGDLAAVGSERPINLRCGTVRAAAGADGPTVESGDPTWTFQPF